MREGRAHAKGGDGGDRRNKFMFLSYAYRDVTCMLIRCYEERVDIGAASSGSSYVVSSRRGIVNIDGDGESRFGFI